MPNFNPLEVCEKGASLTLNLTQIKHIKYEVHPLLYEMV